MNKFMMLLIGLVMYGCCESENASDTTIPQCVKGIIEDTISSKDLKTVRMHEVDGELHYWLNTDFNHFDGVEYIVDSKCDTVCSFCAECFPPACAADYDGEWTVIWEE